MSYRKLLVRASQAAVIGCLGIATSSWAGAGTTTFTVQATVLQKCSISAPLFDFANYDPLVTNLSAPLAHTGTLSITCTKNSGATIPVTIGLDTGSNGPNAIGTTRAMKSGTTYLNYEIYQPNGNGLAATCTGTTWTSSGGGLMTASDTFGVASPVTFNVCGSVPGGQDPGQGAYSDLVTAQVNF